MQYLNKLLLRQAEKYLGGIEQVPEAYRPFFRAVNESYNHYEKDHRLLERSIELSSGEMIELNEQVRKESRELKKAHDELRATEKIRLEKRLDEEKIQKLKEISEVAIAIQERERSLLGSELHDNINQVLATSMLYIDTAIHNEEMRVSLMIDSKMLIDRAIQELRALSKSLLPPELSQNSLVSALDDMIRSINQLDKLQIFTDFEDIDETVLSEKMKLTIFRIVQEQLTNILKHAKAITVRIELIQDAENVHLCIKDDGVGFDLTQKRRGVGIQNITSRANLLNGEVLINTKPGKGCEVHIIFHKQADLSQQRLAS